MGSAPRPSSTSDEADDAPPARSSSGPLVGALVAGALIVGLIGVVAMQGGSDDDAAEADPPAVAAVAGPREVGPSGYALRLVPAGTYPVGCTSGQGGDCSDY